MKIGIIVAMGAEFKLIESLLENRSERNIGCFQFLEGEIGGKMVVLGRSGIGKVNAALGAMELIKEYAPDYMINTGVAGSIDPALEVMDMVVGERVVYHDVYCGEGNAYGQVQDLPLYYHVGKALVEAVRRTGGEGVKYGLVCSGDKFITDRRELDGIKECFPEGMAVDMESAAIAQTCHLFSIPFMSLRLISDTPGVDNHGEQYRNFWQLAPERSFQLLQQIIHKL